MTSWSNSHTLYWQHLATSRRLVLKKRSKTVYIWRQTGGCNEIWSDMILIDTAFILNHWLSAANILAPSDPMFLIFVRNQRCRVCCVAIWRRRLCMHFWGDQAFNSWPFCSSIYSEKRMNSWLDRADSISEAYQRWSKINPVSSVRFRFLKRKNVQYPVWVVCILWKEETLGPLPFLIFDKTVTVEKHSAIDGNK